MSELYKNTSLNTEDMLPEYQVVWNSATGDTVRSKHWLASHFSVCTFPLATIAANHAKSECCNESMLWAVVFCVYFLTKKVFISRILDTICSSVWIWLIYTRCKNVILIMIVIFDYDSYFYYGYSSKGENCIHNGKKFYNSYISMNGGEFSKEPAAQSIQQNAFYKIHCHLWTFQKMLSSSGRLSWIQFFFMIELCCYWNQCVQERNVFAWLAPQRNIKTIGILGVRGNI